MHSQSLAQNASANENTKRVQQCQACQLRLLPVLSRRGHTTSSWAWEKRSSLQPLYHFLFCFLATSAAKREREEKKNPLNGQFPQGREGKPRGSVLKLKKKKKKTGTREQFHCSEIIRKELPCTFFNQLVFMLTLPRPFTVSSSLLSGDGEMEWCTAKYKLANIGAVAAVLKGTFQMVSGAGG